LDRGLDMAVRYVWLHTNDKYCLTPPRSKDMVCD
jgi:hypothetical protein